MRCCSRSWNAKISFVKRSQRGSRCHQRFHTHRNLVRVAVLTGRSIGDSRQHYFCNVFRCTYRMGSNSISDFACNSAHVRIHSCNVYRNNGVVNRARIKQRYHQVELVTITVMIQRGAVLPTIPYAANCDNILPHPRPRRMIFQPETTSNMTSDLRT